MKKDNIVNHTFQSFKQTTIRRSTILKQSQNKENSSIKTCIRTVTTRIINYSLRILILLNSKQLNKRNLSVRFSTRSVFFILKQCSKNKTTGTDGVSVHFFLASGLTTPEHNAKTGHYQGDTKKQFRFKSCKWLTGQITCFRLCNFWSFSNHKLRSRAP